MTRCCCVVGDRGVVAFVSSSLYSCEMCKLSCGLYSMHFDGTIILLYFKEMLPRTVSMGVHDFPIVKIGLMGAINHCFSNKSQTDPSP